MPACQPAPPAWGLPFISLLFGDQSSERRLEGSSSNCVKWHFFFNLSKHFHEANGTSEAAKRTFKRVIQEDAITRAGANSYHLERRGEGPAPETSCDTLQQIGALQSVSKEYDSILLMVKPLPRPKGRGYSFSGSLRTHLLYTAHRLQAS